MIGKEMTESGAVVELKDVSVRSRDHDVLKHVTASFPRGKSTVVVGPSGCGKSVLLKTAAGIIPPDSGTVMIEGLNLLRMSEKQLTDFRRRSGFVFQDAALWANKTIFENLALPLQFHFRELSREEVETRVQRLLQKMELSESMSLRPSSLSTGERKIVSFLRAQVLNPTILFLDEPTLSIDSRVVGEMTRTILAHKDADCSLLTVTHDSGLTSMIADYLVVMSGGRVLTEGAFSEVRQSPDREVQAILSRVLDQAISYDADLLELLDGEGQ